MILTLQKTTDLAVGVVFVAQWLLDFLFARVVVTVGILDGHSCSLYPVELEILPSLAKALGMVSADGRLPRAKVSLVVC